MIKDINNKDLLIVQKNGKSFVKDLNNIDIIGAGYNSIVYDENGGFIITDENNMQGYYTANQAMIVPKYALVKSMYKSSEYLQIKTTAGKKGFINKNGIEFFED